MTHLRQLRVEDINYDIENGFCYLASYYWTADLDVAQDFLFITPDTAGDYPYSGCFISTDETEYLCFVDPTVTDNGTPMTRINRNLNIALDASDCTVFHTPTTTDDGTQLYKTRWGSGKKAGGASDMMGVYLKTNTKYLFRVISIVNDNKLTAEFNWSEK